MLCTCSGRCWLIGICIAQLITVAVRQTFDFLGLQWTAIMANFCQIIGVVIALYASYRDKSRLLAVYSTWTLVWMGWNIFVVFIYLGVGGLKLEDNLMTLNLGLSDSYTWFKKQGFNCMSTTDVAVTSTVQPDEFCILDYHYIEVFQSSLQLFLAVSLKMFILYELRTLYIAFLFV
ncbi:unnamed protein product [Clavelina lepadiformis]|uniref:Sodium/potassium-transporting ATPase subunit beta-1-interacting protein n=1 Tax=Clavelina lepadiformis TaxID=159417 RepID=A0ABP0FXV0_CLALP